VVDLGELEYISSAGIRSILLVAKKLKTLEGELGFACISGMVEKVFNIAGIYALFPMYATLEDALAHPK
jgi:anti-anti-sigma factor